MKLPPQITIQLIKQDETKLEDFLSFKIDQLQLDFVYIKKRNKDEFSLFFGLDLQQNIEKIIQNDTNCLACDLGTLIKGGVAFEDKEIIDYNMTINQANVIIQNLKSQLNISNLIEINEFNLSSKNIQK